MSNVLTWFLAAAVLQGALDARPAVPRPPGAQAVNRQSPPDSEAAAEQELLKLANAARTQSGLSPLRADDCLTRAARQHAALMAARAAISHQFPGEPELPQRIAANCTSPLDEYAENVADAGDAPGAHEGFMRSPSHRENLLHSSYNVAGFGIVRRGSILYVVEDFGHGLPAYSAQRAVDLMTKSVDRARDSAGLPRLERGDNSTPQAEACALAQADSLRPPGAAKPGQARYILRFTTMQPEDLPSAATKALADRSLHAFRLGVCFARSAHYSTGAYWVVLELQ